ncbi:MAG: hypothetical protein D6681_00455 [Calditrichaeota bacterium]|nr:MAG: hypothetical protein D6681_00455 [Calditrichota bacterium]
MLWRILAIWLLSVSAVCAQSAGTTSGAPESASPTGAASVSGDSSLFLSNTLWLNQMRLNALIRLSLWENRQQLIPVLKPRQPAGGPRHILADLSLKLKTGDPYAIPGYDFRSDPSYRVAYARQFVLPEHSQRLRNALMLSPTLLIPVVTRLLEGLGTRLFRSRPQDPYRDLSLGDTEIRMMQLLWQTPGMTLSEWYRQYYTHFDGRRLTFTVFENLVLRLQAKKLVELRKPPGDTQRLYPLISRQQLLIRIRSYLQNSDIISSPDRHEELLFMEQMLEAVPQE